MHTIQIFINRRLQITPKGSPQRRRHVEKGHPLGEFGLGIPAPQDIEQGREEGALEEADEEAEGVQLARGLHTGLRQRPDAPPGLHEREPEAGPDALDDERAGDLHHGVRTGIRRPRVRVFVSVHGQVLLHARHVRIRQVALVQVLHEETQAPDAEDGPVQLQQQAPLLGALEVCIRVPYEGPE